MPAQYQGTATVQSAQGAQNGAPLRTWLSEAKRRDQNIGQIPFDGGSGNVKNLQLYNTGYLHSLRLNHVVKGQYATAGPTGVDVFGQYCGVVKRLSVQANSVAKLFDVSGMTAAILTAINRSYRGRSFTFPPAPYSFTAAPGTAAFTDTFEFDLPVAIHLVNKSAPVGLYETAMQSLQINLGATFNPIAGTVGQPGSGLYTGNGANLGANPTAPVNCVQRYFDPIDAPEAQPPLGYIHQWTDMQFPLTADGDTPLALPIDNIYTRLIFTIVTGGVGALALDNEHLTNLKIGWGADRFPFNEQLADVKSRMNEDYGIAFPAGIYTWDGVQQTQNERDFIDSRSTTNLRAVLTMNGATYSGGAYCLVGMEQLLPIYG